MQTLEIKKVGRLLGCKLNIFLLTGSSPATDTNIKIKNMSEFKLTGVVTISVYTEVEAETLEEAIEIAGERGIENAEHNTEQQVKEAWVSEEYDGEVVEIKEA